MKKKNIILAILLAFASIQLQAQRIVTDESSIDLGQILFRDPITAVYNLKNGGDKPLVIHDVKKVVDVHLFLSLIEQSLLVKSLK